MICKRCGAKFSDGMFCPECGARTISVSGSAGGEQADVWEAALEYSEEEGYNTKLYGPQGQLEEQRITKDIKVEAGGKKVFENKRMICKGYNCIQADNNAKLEFRNCSLMIDGEASIQGASNVRINFENCVIKGNGKLVDASRHHHDSNSAVVNFLNCAFVNKEICDGEPQHLIDIFGSAYFENCFIKEMCIGALEGLGTGQKIELRNCVIINESSKYKYKYPNYISQSILSPKPSFIVRESYRPLIDAEGQVDVEYENCFIRSKKSLVPTVDGNYPKIKLSIKNCYFDEYLHKINLQNYYFGG